MIWTYPRNAEPRLASIKKVAQASGFYDPEVETELNVLVEAPANPLLDMLRRGEPVHGEQRYRVALYVATMLKRVPRSRERGEALIPRVLEDTVAELRTELAELAAQRTVEPHRLQMWLSNLDTAEAKYRVEPPPGVLAELRRPWPTGEMVSIIERMQWRILVIASPEMFITSDNPAFFFEGYGLANPESELCLALSPTHCLHCSHQQLPGRDVVFIRSDRETPREMNRRIASAATNLVFAHERRAWPTKLLRKDNPYLSRINWTA